MNEARKEEGRAVRAGQTQMEKLCLGGGHIHSGNIRFLGMRFQKREGTLLTFEGCALRERGHEPRLHRRVLSYGNI